MPALRSLPRRANGAVNGVLPRIVSTQLPAALQRRAVVRRAEKDDVLQSGVARSALPARVVQRAAGHQPAHAVHQHGDLLQRHRPVQHQLRQLGRRAGGRFARCAGRCCSARKSACSPARRRSSRRDRPPARLFRCAIAGRSCTGRGSSAAPCRSPLQGGPGGVRRPTAAPALVAQAHWRRQRVATGHQVVAHDAIQDRQHGLALRRARRPHAPDDSSKGISPLSAASSAWPTSLVTPWMLL